MSYSALKLIGPAGIRWAQPIELSRLKTKYERRDKFRYDYEETFDGNLTFKGGDYSYLKRINDSERRYRDIRSIMYRECNGVQSESHRAFLSLRECKFDPYRCEVVGKISVDDIYKTYEAKKGDEYNLLSIVSNRAPAVNYLGLTFTNGIRLYDALFGLLRQAFGFTSVTSNFFGWNPDDPSYTIGNSGLLHNIVIWQISDIIRASSAGYQPATILNCELGKLVDDLCKMFNLQYVIDPAGNFRIEHISYFERNVGIDLTLPRYAKYVKGLQRFTYDSPKIFKREVFTMPDAFNFDFIGAPIEYDNAFIRDLNHVASSQIILGRQITEEDFDTTVEVDLFSTDLQFVLGKNKDDADNLKDGIFMAALNSSNQIQSVPSPLPSVGQTPNNLLGWALLHDNFHRHGRLFQTGMMNRQATTFITTQRIKLQDKLVVPLCCDEVFNPGDLVRTALGDGEVRSAIVDPSRNIVELELAFESETIEDIGGPEAFPDSYATEIDTILDTLADGKPSVLSNDLNATSVDPQSFATSRGGTVTIFSNGHFNYVPPLGQTGIDVFEYTALDAVGRADFGQVSIVVKVGTVFVHLVYEFGSVNLYPTPNYLYFYTYTAYFYEDPNLLIPLNTDGYNLMINYTWSDNGVVTTTSKLASGFSTQLVGKVYQQQHTITCTLLPGAYTIV